MLGRAGATGTNGHPLATPARSCILVDAAVRSLPVQYNPLSTRRRTRSFRGRRGDAGCGNWRQQRGAPVLASMRLRRPPVQYASHQVSGPAPNQFRLWRQPMASPAIVFCDRCAGTRPIYSSQCSGEKVSTMEPAWVANVPSAHNGEHSNGASSKPMAGSKKKRGRPVTTGPGTLVGIRWRDDDLSAIEHYAAAQMLDRAEAIRTLVRLGLTAVRCKCAKPRQQ